MAGASYRVRRLKKPDSKNDFDAASLAVPMEIATMLPENVRFSPELTDDGILYRPVKEVVSESGEIPSWITNASGESTPAKPKPARATASKS